MAHVEKYSIGAVGHLLKHYERAKYNKFIASGNPTRVCSSVDALCPPSVVVEKPEDFSTTFAYLGHFALFGDLTGYAR